jgi:hypothetical protein
MYRLCTGDSITARSMREMPEDQGDACQLVMVELTRPIYEKLEKLVGASTASPLPLVFAQACPIRPTVTW